MPSSSARAALIGAPQQAQLQGGGAAAQAQQALAAAEAGDQAEVDFRLADLGGIRGDAQVAGHRQFQATAQCETIHACDDRLGHAFDLAHQRLAQQREITSLNGAESVHFRDVGTGHERLGARPGQYHDAHLRIGGGVPEGIGQGLQGRGVEGIELVRALDGHGADGAVVSDSDQGIGHGETPGTLKKSDIELCKRRRVIACIVSSGYTLRPLS